MFNSGEIELQKRVGSRVMSDRIARSITKEIIPGAIAFIENQPMMIVTSNDERDNLWVSPLMGSAGFVKVTDSTSVSLDMSRLQSTDSDIFFQNIQQHSSIGGLFIELGSRRRFKLNGQASFQDNKVRINVEEAMPNCPKYIQRRIIHSTDKQQEGKGEIISGSTLDDRSRKLIRETDTIFVGSEGKDGHMDNNHRGGNPSFIEIIEPQTLKIPDYLGNNLFSTLGNIMETGKAGILIFDFANSAILQLSGKAEVFAEQFKEIKSPTNAKTGRFWLFHVTEWKYTTQHHNFSWEFLDASAVNP